jgi:hypothetical protein
MDSRLNPAGMTTRERTSDMRREVRTQETQETHFLHKARYCLSDIRSSVFDCISSLLLIFSMAASNLLPIYPKIWKNQESPD